MSFKKVALAACVVVGFVVALGTKGTSTSTRTARPAAPRRRP